MFIIIRVLQRQVWKQRGRTFFCLVCGSKSFPPKRPDLKLELFKLVKIDPKFMEKERARLWEALFVDIQCV